MPLHRSARPFPLRPSVGAGGPGSNGDVPPSKAKSLLDPRGDRRPLVVVEHTGRTGPTETDASIALQAHPSCLCRRRCADLVRAIRGGHRRAAWHTTWFRRRARNTSPKVRGSAPAPCAPPVMMTGVGRPAQFSRRARVRGPRPRLAGRTCCADGRVAATRRTSRPLAPGTRGPAGPPPQSVNESMSHSGSAGTYRVTRAAGFPGSGTGPRPCTKKNFRDCLARRVKFFAHPGRRTSKKTKKRKNLYEQCPPRTFFRGGISAGRNYLDPLRPGGGGPCST